MANKPADLEEEQRFIALRAQGRSYTALSAELGISRSKALAMGSRLALEVALEAALFRQVLLEQYKVAANHRAAAYAEVLGAAFKELAARVRGDGLQALKLPELLAMCQLLEHRLEAEERPAQISQGWQDAAALDGTGEFLAMK